MRRSFYLSVVLVAGIACVGLLQLGDEALSSRPEIAPSTASAAELLQRQPAGFVPNLGQWEHAAKFVHRSGAMTLFVENRGWVLNLVERSPEDGKRRRHGAGLRMTFEGDATVPEIVGEKKFAGHHNYFRGNDESRWRTGVPVYGSVRYENIYAGIDLRLREAKGVPEYDLLLQPGADLSRVAVHVEGAGGLSIASDGSLVIDTAVGRVTQSVPKTWQVDADGAKREVVCNFILLGRERFGFAAPGWDGDTSLTIDPALIYSTLLGTSRWERCDGISVDANGVMTLVGYTNSASFPTTSGVYDTTHNGKDDAFVCRLDPSKNGSAQLVYSTFLGGSVSDYAFLLSVDTSGVVTLAGYTLSTNFPTTNSAYDRTHNGNFDLFVSRLDPSKSGTAQLVYSTFLGGSSPDYILALSVNASGIVTVSGFTESTDFPTTNDAYDTILNGTSDIYVSRLDPSKTGSAQLVYSTFFGGGGRDEAAHSIDVSGVVTLAGGTMSADFPKTNGAYDTTHNGGFDAIVSRLDLRKTGSAQLVYSTFLGGSSGDYARSVSVDASGVVTLAGSSGSTGFPTTNNAYDMTYNGGFNDVFVSRLDPSKAGSAQLVYSTFLGGSGRSDDLNEASVDASGVVTLAGGTRSADFPTTNNAYDVTYNGNGATDGFVSRLDPSRTGTAQLVYSTFLGSTSQDSVAALSVDASGVATVAGDTDNAWPPNNFPTTPGAYDTTHNGFGDAFVSRLSMGVALYADRHELSLKTAGTQNLTLEPGKQHAGRSYWIYGSFGTTPGINVGGVRIPLNPAPYTYLALALTNSSMYQRFSGTLDGNGQATAALNPPTITQTIVPFTVYHAYVVYDGQGIYMASNAVPLRLTN